MTSHGPRAVVALVLAGALLAAPAAQAEPPAMRAADELQQAGIAHLHAGRFREAADAFRQVLALRRRVLPAGHPTVAAAAQNLGIALMQAGDTAGAIEAFEETLRSDEGQLGPEDPGLLDLLRTLGRLTYQRGDYLRAQGHVERQLKILETLAPDQREPLGRALYEYGTVLAALGLLVEAETALGEASAALTAHPDPKLAVMVARARGDVLLQSGRLAEAQAAFEAALRQAAERQVSDELEVALARLGLGQALSGLGLYGEAQDQLSRALTGISKAAGTESVEAGTALAALGQLYERLGDPIAAGRHYAAAVTAYGRKLGPRHPRVGLVLAAHGLLLASVEDLDAARLHLDHAGALIREGLGPEHPGLAIVERGLGDLARQRGELANAQRHYEAALALAERRLPAHHPTVLGARLALALTTAAQGAPGAGLKELDGALLVATAAYGPLHVEVATVLASRALIHLQLSQADDAAEDLRRAWAIRAAVRDVVSRGPFAEVTRARFATTDRVVDDTLLDLTAGRAGASDDAAARLVAMMLDRKGAFIASQLPPPTLPDTPAARQLHDELREVSGRLATAWLGQTPASADEVARLLAHRNRVEQRLGAASRAMAARARTRGADAKALCAAMPRGAVLVDYARLARPRVQTALDVEWREALLAVVIHADGCRVTAHDLGPWAPIADLLKAHREAVERSREHGNETAEALGRQLYDALISPWAELAARAPLVFVSPDRELTGLPFAALVAPDDRYLLDAMALVTLDHPRDLLRLTGRPPLGHGILGVADPEFGEEGAAPATGRRRGATCPDLDRTRWGALPAGREIAGRLGRAWGEARQPVRILSGEAAAEEAVKRLAPGRRVVSLLTHGFTAPDTCRQPGAAARNPLLLSGLVLAGANGAGQGGDDGWLTAFEAARLDLSGVEAVVLPGGGVSNDAIPGLRRGLVHAGARAVVLPVWPVDSEVAAAFAALLHERLAACAPGRCTKLDALRSAQSALRTDLESSSGDAPIADWAPFTYTGEWER